MDRDDSATERIARGSLHAAEIFARILRSNPSTLSHVASGLSLSIKGRGGDLLGLG